MRVNSELASKCKGFSKSFDHSRDEEIACQLDHVGGVSLLAGDESLLPNSLEKWLAPFDLFGRSSGNNEQLRGSGDIRPAEDCRSNIVLLSLPVCFGQTARQGHANRTHGDMNGTGRQGLNSIAGRKDDTVHGSVIRQHGDEHLCIDCCFAWRFGNPGAQGREWLSAASRPVVNCKGVSHLDQVASYRRSHISQTNESYSHSSVSFR